MIEHPIHISRKHVTCVDMCGPHNHNSNCIFHDCRTMVSEGLDVVAYNMFVEPPVDLNDDSFMDHYVMKPESFV